MKDENSPAKVLPPRVFPPTDLAPDRAPDCAATDPAWVLPPSRMAAVAPAMLCRSSKSESSEAAVSMPPPLLRLGLGPLQFG